MSKRELLQSLVGKPVQIQVAYGVTSGAIDIYVAGVQAYNHIITAVGDEMFEAESTAEKRKLYLSIDYVRQVVVATKQG